MTSPTAGPERGGDGVGSRTAEEQLLWDIFGSATVRFWQCPIREHAQRRGVVTVEWVDDVAHCTMPDCDRTSVTPPTDAESEAP